ncbi:MAG: type II toxin-antitoxin system RatA family toxin [Myxococcota bacterium]
MSRAEETIVIDAPLAKVWSVVTDYERYPEFLPEMTSVSIVSRHDNVVVARFDLELMMRFSYTLRLEEDPPAALRWTLDSAGMMVSNSGGWQLEAEGQKTRATYVLDVELKGLIPKSVKDRLLGLTLPQTLERFKKRAEGR